MKIAAVQLNSTDSVEANLNKILNYLEEGAAGAAGVLFFPENSLFFRIQEGARVEAVSLSGPELKKIREACRRLKISAHLTTPLKIDGSVYNASVLIDKNDGIKCVYKKIHLFDIELKNQKPIRESDVFRRGEASSVFDSEGFTFGSSICYDIRFAELYSLYAAQSVDAIVVPSAFLVKTGQAHWEHLLRARAIESQCYVIAPAQAGLHTSMDGKSTRETYGHSMIVDPWGKVTAVLATGEALVYAELDKSLIESVRTQIPMRQHRKKDLR